MLKRYLGRFVKEGSLDVERIQSQISQGWVEIENLEVDTNVSTVCETCDPRDLKLRAQDRSGLASAAEGRATVLRHIWNRTVGNEEASQMLHDRVYL